MVTEVDSRSSFPVFDGSRTINASGNIESVWIHLYEYYRVHGVNGLFGGSGTLKLEWKVAAHPDDTLAGYTEFMAGLTSSDSPFAQPLALDPGSWIRFRATETGTSNSITGLTMYLIQTGGKLR